MRIIYIYIITAGLHQAVRPIWVLGFNKDFRVWFENECD